MIDKSLYKRLKRLFSTGVIVRQIGGRKLKVADTDSIQTQLSTAMRDRYARIHQATGYGKGSAASSYAMNAAFQSQRLMLFRDYDIMDMDSIIHSALDIYADESTVKNEYGEILTIESDNENIKEILHNLYYDILNVEFNLYMWIRSLCKYGDFFLFLEISPEYGVHNVMPLSVYDTIRIEGEKLENPYYVYFETAALTGQKQKLENFEVAHFRLLGDPNFLPYGKSALEGGRRVFRQLLLMEDAMLIHRIMRAPEKRVFKIDIGNIPPSEVDNYMQNLADRTKKVPFMDPATGDYNLRYNMQNLLEDFYIPVRGGDSGTEITNLGGLEYNAIDDIQYLLNRLLASLKIPKAFLGYEEGLSGKLTLAAEDVRFARTIERIQRIVESELYKIGIVHLYSQGFTDEELINFKVSLTTPSTVYEQEKVNLWKEKILLARDMIDTKLFSTDWVYDQLFDLPREDFERERELIIEDTKRTFRYEAIQQGQSDPAKFGFPQDQEPPPMPEEGMGGGEMGGEQPAADGTPGMPQESVGRPVSGMSYAQDSHPAGRDPLGFKERYHVIGQKQKRTPTRKSPLSLESSGLDFKALDMKLGKFRKRSVLSESAVSESADPDAGTFLDEKILENVSEDE